jgi:hypothetical protein
MFPVSRVVGHLVGITRIVDQLDDLLDQMFVGEERISRAEIERRAVTAELPARLMERVAALPEGEYAEDEVAEILRGEGGA